MIPGWAILAFGGAGLISCVLHLAFLFTTMKSFVTSLIPTSLLVSGFILTLFQLLTSAGAPLYALFIIYSCFQIFFIIFAAIYQPWKVFLQTDIPKRGNKVETHTTIETPLEEVKKEEKLPEQPTQPTELNQTTQPPETTQPTKPTEPVQEEKDPEELREEQRLYFVNEASYLEPQVDEEPSTENQVEEVPVVPQTPSEHSDAPATDTEKSKKTEFQEQDKAPEQETPKQAPKNTKSGHEKPNVWKQFFSVEYICSLFYMIINSLVFTWYTGTLFNQFALMGDNGSNFLLPHIQHLQLHLIFHF